MARKTKNGLERRKWGKDEVGTCTRISPLLLNKSWMANGKECGDTDIPQVK